MYESEKQVPSKAMRGSESAAAAQQDTPDFSRREIKKLVHDLFTPKPLLYWADFLITVSIGYGFAGIYLMRRPSHGFRSPQVCCRDWRCSESVSSSMSLSTEKNPPW